jgi:hypothetical protein
MSSDFICPRTKPWFCAAMKKNKCQALERTQMGLPLSIGHIRTHVAVAHRALAGDWRVPAMLVSPGVNFWRRFIAPKRDLTLVYLEWWKRELAETKDRIQVGCC